MNISRLFTPETRRSLAAANEDYVSKDTDEYALIEKLKIENNLDRVYRFDIGRNSDGYSELIKEVMDQADLVGLSRANLIDYPDNQYNLLRNHLADQHGLEPSWFVISAGLESMIDHISRVFIKDNIAFLSAVPNFSVFLAFSARMGGRPVYLPVRPEENFQWTHGTVRGLIDLMQKYSPRLLWVSNPVNPTGQQLPVDWMTELAAAGLVHETAVVVDEAYGEYTDRNDGLVSSTQLLHKFPNLMVLRTFSKIHALPSLRVGYLMCSNRDILDAISLYRLMFPFSWFSLFVAQIASVDDEHVQFSRTRNARWRSRLYTQLANLETFIYIPSKTNTLMLKNSQLKAVELGERFAKRGFLTADLSRVQGLENHEFIRITICREEENDFFVEACRRIEQEIMGTGVMIND